MSQKRKLRNGHVEWTDLNDEQRRRVFSLLTDRLRLRIIESIMHDSDTDETVGDWTERSEAVIYVASGGARGDGWGKAECHATELGVEPVLVDGTAFCDAPPDDEIEDAP